MPIETLGPIGAFDARYRANAGVWHPGILLRAACESYAALCRTAAVGQIPTYYLNLDLGQGTAGPPSRGWPRRQGAGIGRFDPA